MSKTRKIQVTLEAEDYERVEEIARREGKKLAAVVRESIVQHCLGPEQRRQRLAALRRLEALEIPTGDYAAWKQQYAELKSGKPPAPDRDDRPS